MSHMRTGENALSTGNLHQQIEVVAQLENEIEGRAHGKRPNLEKGGSKSIRRPPQTANSRRQEMKEAGRIRGCLNLQKGKKREGG